MKLLFFFLFIFPFSLFGQIDQYPFTNEQLSAFVNVWIKSKSISNNHENSIRSLLVEFNISEERYGELIKSRIDGKPIEFGKKESEAIKNIENLNEQIKANKNDSIKQLCLAQNISFDLYSDIFRSWESDPSLKTKLQQVITKLSETK